MDTYQKGRKRMWDDDETEALLQIYQLRQHEMQSRKKKFAFQRILEDLQSMNVLKAPTTVSNLQAKIISLQRAHQCAASTENKMGEGASGFQFMKIMNNIFGLPSTSDPKPAELLPTAKVPSSSASLQTSSSVSVQQLSSVSVQQSSSVSVQLSSSVNVQSSSLSSVQSSSSASIQSSNDEYSWSDGQVCALLDCYQSRKEELNHPTKKKFFYPNVLQDLVPLGVFKRPITASQLETKMNRLLQAFKSARDAENCTGSGSTKFKYMATMEEIFGNRPIIQNSHTKNLYGVKIDAVPVHYKKRVTETMIDDEVIAELVSEEEFSSSNRGLMTVEASNETGGLVNVQQNVQVIDSEDVAGPSVPRNVAPTNVAPTNVAPTNVAPTNVAPTNVAPTNVAPTNVAPTNVAPTNVAPTNVAPTNVAPTNVAPTNVAPTNVAPKNVVQKNATATSTGTKLKKVPFSFTRTKTTKEIVQESKKLWEKEKLEKRANARMDQLKFVEENKQRRHEERSKIMKKLLEKM